MFERTIADIAELLTESQAGSRRCSVLIGAGCSKSAGIPLAADIVAEIKRTYPAAYARARTKDYPNCMAALNPGVRRELMGRYIDQAKINWAHLALAQLVQAGYIDRILTTNFDPLVSRACALVGVFPAVYDFAASHIFKPDQISKQAIFHLHGQRDGFVMLNTPTEVQKHRRHVKPVFDDAHRGRTWLVIGYSGDNDPVFDLLASTAEFEYGLYWVGHSENPPTHVMDKLLTPEKGAYYLPGWDADDFFVSLAQKLNCFPPSFLKQPFTYLKTILTTLTDYKAPHEEGRFDVSVTVREHLDDLIDTHEPSLSAEYHFLSGEYDRVVALLQKRAIRSLSIRDRHTLAWAYIMRGNRLHDEAKQLDSEALSRAAIDNFRRAARIDGNISAAFYNWGNALFDLSLLRRFGAPEVMTRGAERALWSAVAKYKAALSIEPRFSEAHNNLANALTDLRRGSPDRDELNLLNEALPHYAVAAPRSETPDLVYCNWGKALHDLARITGSRRDFKNAFAKFKIAARFNPQHYSTFLSWGNALSDLGRRCGSVRLFEEAFEKYRQAAEIDRSDTAAYFNWLNDVATVTRLATGAKKESLLREAATVRRKLDFRRKRLIAGRDMTATSE